MKPLRIALVVVAVLSAVGLCAGVVRPRRASALPSSGSLPPVIKSVAAGQRIRLLAAADGQTCALYTEGKVACWGRDSRPSLGLPESNDAELEAMAIPDVDHAVALVVGERHGCVLDGQGQVACWGYCNYRCQAGSPTPLFTRATRIEQVPRVRLMVADGIGDVTCGVGADDALHCWMERSAGMNWFGDPTPRSIDHLGPERSGAGRRAPGVHAAAVELMSSTNGAQCTRYADDHVRCWSEGRTDGDLKPYKSLEAPAEPVTSMSGSFSQGCFVLRSGDVECRSGDGVLRPPFGSPARTAAATGSSVCATGRDGSLMCTGYRFDSGDRNIERLHGPPTYQPFRVDVGGPARVVVAGSFHFCALREDDAVYCWGSDGTTRPKRIVLL